VIIMHVRSIAELYPGPFGLVSDAHGNPRGLRASLDRLSGRGAKTIFFLGDAVGYLPLERDVVRFLRDCSAICISGNHEAMLVGRLPSTADEVYRIAAARTRLSAAELDEIASWPNRRIVADQRAPGRPLMLVHGSPSNPLQAYVYPDSDISFIDDLDVAAVACGQTHRPFIARRGSKLVINCGSVGLPRDIGSSASCALLDLAALDCEILRETFDVDRLLDDCDRVEPPHPSVVAVLRRTLKADAGEQAK
jgi:predicted phosphodiesterase